MSDNCPACGISKKNSVRQSDGKMQCRGCGTRYVDGDTPDANNE